VITLVGEKIRTDAEGKTDKIRGKSGIKFDMPREIALAFVGFER
jgi:hypothetical protein